MIFMRLFIIFLVNLIIMNSVDLNKLLHSWWVTIIKHVNNVPITKDVYLVS